ncbi:acetyl-CoA hydrolase/transferase family protein [Cumulibacter soli]|uniref:acetyl-CoA hydrolase/transferase family protein n=1 Tax=Cumulibacter soli TaxID=2546344 RepID=UPI0010686037|nr:acetyl-CoA hydrolase/transferase C-terminal domain-containing protein [Cumulibacter soli]
MIEFRETVRPGAGIWWSQGAAEPYPLVDTLIDQVHGIGGITAFCGLSWHERFSEPLPEEIHIRSYGGLGTLRRLSAANQLDVVPCHFSALPRLFRSGRIAADVGLVQVSPPNEVGLVTLGIGVDYAADALAATNLLVAEVNQQMPQTVGGPQIPLERFAAVIHTDRPLPSPPNREPSAVDAQIAQNVCALIDDGATLQVGVGTLGNAILQGLRSHRDLGLHSGMIADGVVDLVERGVMTGRRKELDGGLLVAGAGLGTDRLYRAVRDLPVEFRPVSYTHDPSMLAKLSSLIAVNFAIEVDLSGNVGAETVNGVQVGAIGGQSDFARAASSTGSRSIIALRSTNRGQSTISPQLIHGPVTTSRADVDVVVTEHGAAHLTGCSLAERARRMIEIAAPEHRERLSRAIHQRTREG